MNFIAFRSKYTCVKLLGKGSGSDVYIAQRKSDDIPFVCKHAFRKKDTSRFTNKKGIPSNQTYSENEWVVPMAVNTSSVVEIVEKYIADEEDAAIGAMIVMRRQKEFEDMHAYFFETLDRDTSETALIPVIYNMLVAVNDVHSAGFIHMDIKTENFLYNPLTKHVILIDFEFSRRPNSDKNFMCGTKGYVSPEVMNRQTATFKSDIYSFGAMVYYIFEDSSYPGSGVESSFRLSATMKQFIAPMLREDPNTRPTAEECLADPIWAGIPDALKQPMGCKRNN